MLIELAAEMLERRRALYAARAKEFGFEAPPEKGDRAALDSYAQNHAEDLERADILSEMRRIDARYGK